MKIPSIIIEDEPEALKGMYSLLKMFCPEVEIIGDAHSVKSGIKLINDSKPKLVFLDIQLKDGNGFDLLKAIEVRDFHTIFVTAFDQFAIRALRLNALDYLLKPVEPEELIASVQKVRNSELPEYKHLLRDREQGAFTKIGVPGSKGTRYIELSDIVRLEASNNYTYLHVKNEKSVLVARTIKSFEEVLPETEFLRCHQSHIVNLNCVTAVEKEDGTYLLLHEGTKVPVSRAKRIEVQNALAGRFPSL